MRPGTLLRLAVAGTRTDTLRVVLTAVSSLLATLLLLCALTLSYVELVNITGHGTLENPIPADYGPTDLYQYDNPSLLSGSQGLIVLVLYLLTGGLLALAAQCIRLGTPARDRRLAAIRLAGATPRQATLVVIAETGLASLIGSIAALAAYVVLRSVLHRPNAAGQLWWPTDVRMHPLIVTAAVVVTPVLAALFGTALLRRVIVTPLGVVRRTTSRPPRMWVGLIIIGAIAVVALVPPVAKWLILVGGSMHLVPTELVIAAVVMAAVIGLVAVTGRISYATGQLVHRLGRGPAAVLAAGRLTTDPWHASRSGAALWATVVLGAGFLAFRERTLVEARLGRQIAAITGENAYSSVDRSYYFGDPEYVQRSLTLANWAVVVGICVAVAGVLVALAEGITARRRTYVSLVAAGVPRQTLIRSIAWHLLAPLTTSLILALALGTAIMRLITGTKVEVYGLPEGCPMNTSCMTRPIDEITGQKFDGTVDVPVAELLTLGAGTLAAMLLVVGVAALLLRTTTDVEELRAA